MPKSIAEQWFEACVKAARADHYLVTVRAPMHAEYEDACEVAQLIIEAENAGCLSHDLATRAFIMLSESSGYSFSDLNC